MSIASAITAAQGRVENAYTAVSNMGGTLPATQDLTNLPTAIESIPTGGGGDTVQVRAVAGTELYDTDDKVILIPTGDLYSDSIATWGANNTSLSGVYFDIPGFGCLDYNGVQAMLSSYVSNSSQTFRQIKARWNSTYTDFTNVTTAAVNVSNPFYDVYYTNKYTWALKSTDLYYSKLKFSDIGLINSDGVFVSLASWGTAWSSSDPGYGGDAVDKFFKVFYRDGTAQIFWINDSGSISSYTPTARNGFPSKFNGNWYLVYGNSNGVAALSSPSTPVYNCTGFFTYTDGPGIRFFDDNVDYYWEYSYTDPKQWYFRKVNKSASGWSITNLPAVASAYFSSLQGGYLGPYFTTGTGAWRMRSKDHGTTVESFLVGGAFGYDYQGSGNKVAHFIFDKSTETVTRLPDAFLDIPDVYTRCEDLQVNWDLGLIAVTVSYVNSPDTTHHCAIYVKKLDNLAGLYKYYAFPNQNQYYINSSLTGFVTQNEGSDIFDNTVLEVSTVEDPTAPPWSNIGVVFGMDITVDPIERLTQSFTGTLDNLNMAGIVMSLNMSGAQSTLTDSKYIMKSIVFSKPSTLYTEGSDVYLNVFEMKSGESTYSYVSSSTNATHTTLSVDGSWSFTGIEVNVNSKYLITATTSPSPLLTDLSTVRARVYSVPSGSGVGSFSSTSCDNPPTLSFAWVPVISIGLEKIEEGSIHISNGYYNSGTYQINMPLQQVSFSTMSSGQNLGGKNSPFACSYNDTASVALTSDNAPTGTYDVYVELDHPLYVNSEGNYLLGDSVVSSIGIQALTTYGGFKTLNTGVVYDEEQNASFWYPSTFTKTLAQLKSQENLSDVNNLFYVNISGKDESDIVASHYDTLEGHLIPGQVVFAQNSPGDATVELNKGLYKITVVGGGGGSAAHGSGGSGTYTSGSLTAVNNGQTVWGGEGH